MSKTIVVCGHGVGISDAVARKFAAKGFQVALVARSKDKLHDAELKLMAAGVKAKAFPCDLGDAKAVTQMIADVKSTLGPPTVLHWNAVGMFAGDLATSPLADVQKGFDVSVTGLLAAVQAALPDLKAQKEGAVLVTGGGFAFYDPNVDAAATAANAQGVALSKAAQHKLAGLLHQRLKRDGVYVGEVVVLGLVKGTAWDAGNATLDPNLIASKFYELYEKRADATVNFQ